MVVYAALPLPSELLSVGRWGALACYAATPWIVHLLRRAAGLESSGLVRRSRGGACRRPGLAPPSPSRRPAGAARRRHDRVRTVVRHHRRRRRCAARRRRRCSAAGRGSRRWRCSSPPRWSLVDRLAGQPAVVVDARRQGRVDRDRRCATRRDAFGGHRPPGALRCRPWHRRSAGAGAVRAGRRCAAGVPWLALHLGGARRRAGDRLRLPRRARRSGLAVRPDARAGRAARTGRRRSRARRGVHRRRLPGRRGRRLVRLAPTARDPHRDRHRHRRHPRRRRDRQRSISHAAAHAGRRPHPAAGAAVGW